MATVGVKGLNVSYVWRGRYAWRGTVCPQIRTWTTGLVNGYVSSTTEELVIHCCVRWLLVH